MILYRNSSERVNGINPSHVERFICREDGVMVWTVTGQRLLLPISEGDWLDAIRETTKAVRVGADELAEGPAEGSL